MRSSWVKKQTQRICLAKLNVRYVITDVATPGPPEPGAVPRLTTERLEVWELPDVRSRAWFVDDPDRAITVASTDAGHVEVSTPNDSPGGVLVISQVDYPGWKAQIDGESVAIEQYQGTLQALNLSAGAHHIELRFQPRYWTIWIAGAVLSAVAVIVAFALTVIPTLRRKVI